MAIHEYSDSKLLTTLILRHIILLTRSKIVIKVSTHDTKLLK